MPSPEVVRVSAGPVSPVSTPARSPKSKPAKKPVASVPAPIPPIPLTQRPESFLRLPQVISRTGMCKAKIYRLEGFPKPVKVGGSTSGWIESEVDAWIAETIAEGRRNRKA